MDHYHVSLEVPIPGPQVRQTGTQTVNFGPNISDPMNGQVYSRKPASVTPSHVAWR